MIQEKGGDDMDTFEGRYKGTRGIFQVIPQEEGEGPAKSIEGWILFVSGIHEEADEDDIIDLFSKYGPLKHLHINIDRKTGYLKGYGMIEYDNYEAALEAKNGLNGYDFLGRTLKIDFAFKKNN